MTKLANFWQKFWRDPSGNLKLAEIFDSPLFWFVLVLKIAVGTLLASTYLTDLFIPFLEQFAHRPLDNPYHIFWENGQVRAFPYPALMLYIMSAPRLFVSPFWPEHASPFLEFFIYRLPLLAADFLTLAILVRWLRQSNKKVILLYWASPVLFYITYMHGQLDCIPIALLFLSLYLLFQEKLGWAAIILGFAVATKTHTIIALPFFAIYVYQRDRKLRPALAFVLLAALAFLLPNLPYISDIGFEHMVFKNAEQGKLLQAAISFSPATQIYIIPALYLFLLFQAVQMPILNRDLFLFLLGFSFGSLIFFIVPMPGWYFWIIPFFAYFFAKATRLREAILLYALQAAYLLYFGVIAESDYPALFSTLFTQSSTTNVYSWLKNIGFDTTLAVNGTLTIMQVMLLGNCIWIYRHGVRNMLKRKLGVWSYLIGISGDSGSGKSTLAQTLADLFGSRLVSVMCGDDRHKWQRGDKNWQKLTHLDPRANDLHQELETIRALRRRRPVLRRQYDHDTGTFTELQPIRARPIMVLEGLHTFYLKPARAALDLKIFMHPDEELLKHWKITRDMINRGYSKEKVLSSLAQRAEDAEKYIRIQEQNADIIVAFKLRQPLENLGDTNEDPQIYLSLNFSNHFFLDAFIEDLRFDLGDKILHSFDAHDRQLVDIYAPVEREVLERLAERHIAGLQDLGLYTPHWQSHWAGLLQLFLAYCICYDNSEHAKR